MDRASKFCATVLAVAVVTGLGSLGLWSQSATQAHPATIADQLATEDRLRKSGWWPTKGSFPASAFVGDGTCSRCHADIASALDRDAASYDQHCLSCHINSPGAKTTADHPGAACPAARKDCVGCHMPKYRVEDIPVEFTDHQIRVVRRSDLIPK